MKKITFLSFLLLSALLVNAQAIFEEDWETTTNLSGWTVVDVDAQTPNANVATVVPSGWAQRDNGGNQVATSTSWYTPAGTSDDWLISPAIVLAAGSSNTLRWTGRAIDPAYPDGYEVRISTTGTTVPGDFGTVLFSVAAEDSSATGMVHTVDLAPYAGNTVYIAWRNNSSDQFLLDIDDIFVGVPVGNPPGAANTPSPADMATGVLVDTADNNGDGLPDNSVDFNWLPDGSLGATAPDEYEVFLGDSPTTLNSLGVLPATATLPVGITGLFYNTTYYWQVVPSNVNGAAMNNPIWSFTTEMGNITAPDAATTPLPADMATNVMLDTTDGNGDGNPDNAVDFSWVPAGTGDPADFYIFRIGTTTAVDLFSSNRGPNTTIRLLGLQPSTTYFWRIDPTNTGGANTTGPVWQFTTDAAASIIDESISAVDISIFPNPASDVLNISSEISVTNISISNALGQEVLKQDVSNNTVDVSRLSNGVYFISLRDGENLLNTIQFVKE